MFNQDERDEHYPLFPRRPNEDSTSRAELDRLLCKVLSVKEQDTNQLADEIHRMVENFLNESGQTHKTVK